MLPLTEQDIYNLGKSFITPELARQARLFRVDSDGGATLVGANRRSDYAGIVFPYYWPGETSPREYRLRRDYPDLEQKSDGKLKETRKYLSPPGRGNLLYFMPDTPPEWLHNTCLPIVIVEGEKKTIALSRLSFHSNGGAPRFLPAGIPGVWNWRGVIGKTTDDDGARRDVKGPIADLGRMAWKGRPVYIIFDTNVATNESVRAARRELGKELAQRGANVIPVDLPRTEGVNGVDDLLAVKGPEFVLVLLEEANTHGAEPDERPSRKSQATTLLELASEAELFHTPEGEPYASIKVGNHLETWPLKSRGFRDWLMMRFFEAEAKALSTQAIQDALGVLSGRARFGGEEREVYVRVASHKGEIYIDLADQDWRVVRICADGWEVISGAEAPVRFRRPRGSLPLPVPTSGGTLAELRPFVNVATDADWLLTLGWLTASLRPGQPMPLLALYGTQGSAKSTTARVLVSLIDPTKAALRSEPRDERDLMIAARNRWCLPFDNLSHISGSFSDALCRLSTGGGLSTRELYSDDEEVLFEAMRPVIINGIEDLATRGDLLDRAVVLYLPALNPATRKKEADFWQQFESARPRICGALYDAVSAALRNVGSVRLGDLPRMADFAAWATAAEPAFCVPSGAFLRAYSVNRRAANVTVLDDSPLSEALMKLLEASPKPFWSGRASDLLNELKEHVSEQTVRDKAWPKAANVLTNKLRRLAPSLRGVGIDFRESRVGQERTRMLTLERTGNSSSAPSASSSSVGDQYVREDDHAEGFIKADGLGFRTGDFFAGQPPAAKPVPRIGDTVFADDADDSFPDFSGGEASEEAAFAECCDFFTEIAREEAERRVWEGYE